MYCPQTDPPLNSGMRREEDSVSQGRSFKEPGPQRERERGKAEAEKEGLTSAVHCYGVLVILMRRTACSVSDVGVVPSKGSVPVDRAEGSRINRVSSGVLNNRRRRRGCLFLFRKVKKTAQVRGGAGLRCVVLMVWVRPRWRPRSFERIRENRRGRPKRIDRRSILGVLLSLLLVFARSKLAP